MPITPAQRERRKHHIGSSDMAAILGLDPKRNAYDVFLEKKGRIEEQPASAAMVAGTNFEDGVLRFAQQELGDLRRNVYRSFPAAYLGSNIDALLKKVGEPVEAKTAGLYGPLAEQWGEAGTDEVPERVIVQTHVHMICTDRPVCHVPAFIGGRGFQMYRVDRSDDLKAVILERATIFWERHVLRDVPPDDCIPSLDLVKRCRRQPNKTIFLPLSLRDQWEQAKAIEAEAVKNRKAAEAALLAAMGDAEAADFGDGGKVLTYMEQTRKSYTVAESKYRVLRTKDRQALPAPTVEAL